MSELPSEKTPANSVSEAGSGFLAECIQALQTIPGAVNAIARLVTGLGDAGAAWIDIARAQGEKRAASVRADKAAIQKVAEALSSSSASLAARDDVLVSRAAEAWLSTAVRKQVNKESIAKKTVELLESDPPPEDTAGPSDDWMNRFERYAEDASSERLRDMWAMALAGEIRKPGEFSLITLDYLSKIDKRIADVINRALPFVLDNSFIPLTDDNNTNPPISILIALERLGFGQLSARMLTQFFNTNDQDMIWIYQNEKAIVLEFEEKKEIQIKSFLLTIPGGEISSLLKVSGDLESIATYFCRFSPKRISVGDVSKMEGGGIKMVNPKIVTCNSA